MRVQSSLQAHPVAIPSPPVVEILGVPLALTDYDEMLDWIDAAVDAGIPEYLTACNTHTLTASLEDDELRDALLGASLNLPDGQPLVWALDALGHPLQSRVYGPELMARACGRAAERGHRLYLYGGRNQGALVQLALNLRQRHPGIRIVGGYSPPYRALTDEESTAVADEINHSRADIVWSGIGVPKQEKWMSRMRPRLNPPLLIGVGAAFDFHAGLVSQAPLWMQESGLEWTYRLAHEPRRLWRRYLRYNPRFVGAFVRQLSAHRRAQRQR
jgi:N-acetylglucosaminyldiphosphoundecaprenol N-acetyl-beta-D-mannosaminyltransferase